MSNRTKLSRRILAVALAGVGVATSTATAHEFWIMPDAFRVTVQQLVRVQMFNGERLAGNTVPRNNAMVERFEVVDQHRTTQVVGPHDGTTGFVRPPNTGSGVLVYESREFTNNLPAERFEAYLTVEGLTNALASRRDRGESAKLGREVYIRCAKSILSVRDPSALGETDPGPTDRIVGLPLEIVLERDQRVTDHGPHTVVRVLLRGEPIDGLPVVAVRADKPEHLLRATTDSGGMARFDGATPGVWLITALHIERTEERSDTDWKSYWGSLSFERTE